MMTKGQTGICFVFVLVAAFSGSVVTAEKPKADPKVESPFKVPEPWKLKSFQKKSGGFIATLAIEGDDGRLRAAATVINGRGAFKECKSRDNFKGGTATVAMFDALEMSIDLLSGAKRDPTATFKEGLEMNTFLKQVTISAGAGDGMGGTYRIWGEGRDLQRVAVGIVRPVSEKEGLEDLSKEIGKLIFLSPFKGREWRSSSGKFTVTAELVSVEEETVKLRKETGEVISVRIDVLSEADQKHVREHGKK